MKRMIRTLSVIGFVVFSAGHLYAATDGLLGTSSTGTATVSVTVPALIKISGMDNMAFGTWPGSGDLNDNQNVCVYTNKAAGTYRITGTGDGSGNAFTMASGGNTLAYSVYYNDATGTTGEQLLTAGTPLTGQSGAHTTSQTCSGGTNGNYHVEVLETDLLAVPSGDYSGLLTLVVEPV